MRVIFGCESARKGSYQAIRTFPLGYASYSQTEVNTLLFRQKSSYSIRSGPKVIHNEHCFQSATDFLIYMQISAVLTGADDQRLSDADMLNTVHKPHQVWRGAVNGVRLAGVWENLCCGNDLNPLLPVSFSLRVRFEQVIVPGQFDAA